MNNICKCFLAYGSEPKDVGIILEHAKEKINSNEIITITSWTELDIVGNLIIDKILNAIDNSELFICDLTSLNPNVLFELGYSIGTGKKIWILLNTSIKNATDDFKKFGLLSAIGYCSYNNSNDIIKELYKQEPYKELNKIIDNIPINEAKNNLLYLKSSIQTEESIAIDYVVEHSSFNRVIDDPKEIANSDFLWYVAKILNSRAVLIHLLSDNHENKALHNAKCALLSGLSYGLQKPLLMLAPYPYDTPLDYRNILKIHNNFDDAKEIVKSFLDAEYQQISQERKKYNSYAENKHNANILQNIDLGEYVAENEEYNLHNYYIETSEYYEAITSNRIIFVGRKGIGKSANLISLNSEFEKDKRISVCKIQPVSYELEGLIRMLDIAQSLSEEGFLIESLWEYLIYTEITINIYTSIKERPAYVTLDENELKFINYVDRNEDIILNDFSIRLNNCVNQIRLIENTHTPEDNNRLKISEKLHVHILSHLKKLLGLILKNKEKVVVLIDNLDKAWDGKNNVNKLSSLILGLLSVSEKIVLDFQKNNNNKAPINFSLLIFLRNDIFKHIIDVAKEKDKIPYTQILWNDKELLIRVLEERFLSSIDKITPDEIWLKFFCQEVKQVETKTYILDCILPKPRDLLLFVQNAKDIAVNRGHSKILEDDILEAENKYSKHALDTIITEGISKFSKIEELLYEFICSKEYITIADIKDAMITNDINEDIDYIVNLLIDLLFLGIQYKKNKFIFIYDDKDKHKYLTMERKYLHNNKSKIRTFKINKAFHAYLEIEV